MAEHAHSRASGGKERDSRGTAGHYVRFGAMILVSFGVMYLLMFAMIDGRQNFFNNLNQVYMAGLMAASMMVIELAIMFSMYPDRKLNVALIATGLVVLGLCWVVTRRQIAIGDEQFLRSMIPHHASAILMCRKAPIQDAEIQRLCRQIIDGQQAEIEQMKAKLAQLDR